jgi:hypothetical protein
MVKPKNPFKLLTNILNNLHKLKQGPGVQIYNFLGPSMAIKMGFGVFTMIPMWWSIRPGQHFWCLPVSETWFQRVARSFEVLQVTQKNSCMSGNIGEPSLALGKGIQKFSWAAQQEISLTTTPAR